MSKQKSLETPKELADIVINHFGKDVVRKNDIATANDLLVFFQAIVEASDNDSEDEPNVLKELSNDLTFQTAFLRFLANSLRQEYLKEAAKANPEEVTELFYSLSQALDLVQYFLLINNLAKTSIRNSRIEIYEDVDLRDFFLLTTTDAQKSGSIKESIIGMAKQTEIAFTKSDSAEVVAANQTVAAIEAALNRIMTRIAAEDGSNVNLEELLPTLEILNKIYNEFVRTKKRTKHPVCKLIQERMTKVVNLLSDSYFNKPVLQLDINQLQKVHKKLKKLRKKIDTNDDKTIGVIAVLDKKMESVEKILEQKKQEVKQ